jgi:hypothetical protein
MVRAIAARGAAILSDRRAHLCRRRLPGANIAKVVAKTGAWSLQIVKRTFAWISRNRRRARDFERYSRTVAAFFRLAMIRIVLRRLTRTTHSA